MIKRNMLLASAMFCSVAAFAGTDLTVYEGSVESVRVVSSGLKLQFDGGKISFDGSDFKKVDSIYVSNYVSVKFDDDTAFVTNPFDDVTVSVKGATVTIDSKFEDREIKYNFSGKSTNGNVIFSSLYKSKFEFDNLDLQSTGVNPPIYVTSKKKTEIVLVGTNLLADSEKDTVGATMRGKGQFEFKGDGSLEITGNAGHGIQSSDYVSVNSGDITIMAQSDGIHVNDYYLQSGGDVNIFSGADGVDVGEGYATIDGGKLTVVSAADEARGIRCTKTEESDNSSISLNGGEVTILLDGVGTRGLKTDDSIKVNGGNTLIVMSGASKFISKDNEANTNTCGLKADKSIIVDSGNVTVICTRTAKSSRCAQSDKGAEFNGGQTVFYQNSIEKVHTDAKKNVGLKTDGNINVAKAGYLYIYADEEKSAKILSLEDNSMVSVGRYTLDLDEDDITEYIPSVPADFAYDKYVK